MLLVSFHSNPIYDALAILSESADGMTRKEELEIQAVLEDGESPVRNHYLEKLYNSVIEKGHIDFDTIPQSKGNIVEYTGYTNMIEILENIQKLASDSKSQTVMEYVNIVKQSIAYMRALAPIYKKGFMTRNEYVMLEYNTFVYTIVEAVSTLLYEFVDYIKTPNSDSIQITLRNTKYRANVFFINQLNKFNKVNQTGNYGKYLEAMIQNGKDNFTGATAVGFAAIAAFALMIIPITRECVYFYYSTKSKISECLAQQAYFLEMNKAVIEANSDFNKKKKQEIIIKQERIKNACLRLSEKLRVTHAKAIDNTKATLQSDNKLLTIDNIKKEVSDSPLQLF